MRQLVRRTPTKTSSFCLLSFLFCLLVMWRYANTWIRYIYLTAFLVTPDLQIWGPCSMIWALTFASFFSLFSPPGIAIPPAGLCFTQCSNYRGTGGFPPCGCGPHVIHGVEVSALSAPRCRPLLFFSKFDHWFYRCYFLFLNFVLVISNNGWTDHNTDCWVNTVDKNLLRLQIR